MRSTMTFGDWHAMLARSDSLRAVSPQNDKLAREAVIAHVHWEAEVGNAPVGIVSDRRFLLHHGPYGHRDGD